MQPTPTTAVPPPPIITGPPPRTRSLHFTLFLAAIFWYLCARALSTSAANIFDFRMDLGPARPLLEALFLLILVVSGLSLLRTIERRLAPLRLTLGLPIRPTSRTEWATGAAFGWALAVAAILPMAFAHTLSVHLWAAPRAFTLAGFSILTLAITTLAHALAVYGYGYQRLIDATSPVRATLILISLVVLHAAFTPTAYGTPDGTRLLVEMLTALLLCLCWLRTHGLWLLWGLHFAWATSTAVLFGLPLGGDNSFASIIDTRASGPAWLTGGEFGPAAAAFSILVLLAAIPLLIRLTDDYAWSYTHPPLIPGGYDVTILPSAEHTVMEQSAESVQSATLVQILPATPQTRLDRDASK
jgi:hypothetical protein